MHLLYLKIYPNNNFFTINNLSPNAILKIQIPIRQHLTNGGKFISRILFYFASYPRYTNNIAVKLACILNGNHIY